MIKRLILGARATLARPLAVELQTGQDEIGQARIQSVDLADLDIGPVNVVRLIGHLSQPPVAQFLSVLGRVIRGAQHPVYWASFPV